MSVESAEAFCARLYWGDEAISHIKARDAAIRTEALEEAAKIADKMHEEMRWLMREDFILLAEKIRALQSNSAVRGGEGK